MATLLLKHVRQEGLQKGDDDDDDDDDDGDDDITDKDHKGQG